MEKKINFFIALLLCATNALAEDVDTTQFTEFGFKGKVKTVTCFYSKEDFGDIVKDKDAIYTFSYDNLGNLKETRSGGDNCVSRYYIYEGNKLTQILISHLGYINSTIKSYNLTDSISLKYDDKGNLIEKDFFSIEYHLSRDWGTIPDDISWIETIKDFVIKYKYNENNKLIEDKLYNKNGSLVYTTIYKYDTNGLLIKEKRTYASDPYRYEDEYDYSYVYGTSKKITRDSCSYGKSKMQLDHRYNYDESGRLKKVDYNFYMDTWTPEGGKEKTQFLPRKKVEYTYNTVGNCLSINYFNYNYLINWNWHVPDKCSGTYKTEDITYAYNNDNNITSSIKTEYRRKFPNNDNNMEIILERKFITRYTYDSYGNWIEKRIFEIKDGLEFFQGGIIRDITYYE
ncbi:MAG: hypothetical protein J5588_04140 [Bacteroidales bacterium]|nr:hypothetical protein [Bacteroidales bacterium]